MNSQELQRLLVWNGPKHSKFLEAIRARLRLSEKAMRDRYAQMADNEEQFQAYIPVQEVDRLRKRQRDANGIPSYTTIELPYSYAILMTSHTYYTSVFLARNPVFQLSGRNGAAETNRPAMEAVLNYQLMVGEMMLPLFCWMLDPGKYGYGVVGHYWDREMVGITREVEEPRTLLGIPIGGTTKKFVTAEVEGYFGNRLYNVRAQDFFPDPRVALAHFQKGEFCSRYMELSWTEIYEGSRGPSPKYFNYERLKALRKDLGTATGITHRDEGSSNVTTLPDQQISEQGYDVPVGFVKAHEFYIKIVPKQWGLGDSERTEIWVFYLTVNGIIFGAMPLGELSNRFPFDILLDEIDGYSIAPRSTLERIKPLNDVMTWLINSHFYNVRQTLNNQFVADPSMVVMKDVENPEPGKIIRLKPEAYGKDVRMALQQLQVGDVTRGHIADMGLMQDVIQRITGVNDTVMGMVNSSGRATATEVRSSTTFGVNRLKTQCEWFSTVGFAPLVQRLVQRTQQHFDGQREYRVVGDLAQLAPQFNQVGPAQISGFYDFEPVDGTLPVDRFAQANLWNMLLQQAGAMPQVLAQYDIARIFAWVAQLAGIKNMAQFKLTPEARMMQQLQAGNVIPLQQAQREIGQPQASAPPLPNVGRAG